MNMRAFTILSEIIAIISAIFMFKHSTHLNILVFVISSSWVAYYAYKTLEFDDRKEEGT